MRAILYALLITLLLGNTATQAADPIPNLSNAVVFAYQRIDYTRHAESVRPEQFAAHLEHLAAENYRIWPLERIVRRLQTGQPIPDRTVAITFDDAYASIYTEAFPRLKERGWPFTVFVSTDRVDRGWRGYMTWEQMREMQENGAAFANHSTNHRHLTQQPKDFSERHWAQYLRDNILNAQARLEEELGAETNVEPKLFSYPYGEYNELLANIVQDLGYVGFGQHPGAIGPYSDLRILPRYLITRNHADPESFARRASSLAMPVTHIEPWEPRIVGNTRPTLEISITGSDVQIEKMRCYYGRWQRAKVTWKDVTQQQVFTMRAGTPMKYSNNHYYCIAPSPYTNREYWFSQLLSIEKAPVKPKPKPPEQVQNVEGEDPLPVTSEPAPENGATETTDGENTPQQEGTATTPSTQEGEPETDKTPETTAPVAPPAADVDVEPSPAAPSSTP